MRKLSTVLAIAVISFIAIFYFSRFSLADSHIRKCLWKSGGPSSIGDVLAFENSSLKIESGFIYQDELIVAQINARKFRFLADDYITIKDVKKGVVSIYYEKGCE